MDLHMDLQETVIPVPRTVITVAIATLLNLACGSDATRDNLDGQSDREIQTPDSISGGFLRNITEIWRVGDVDGVHTAFGRIADVAVDQNGNAIVLDRYRGALRVFDDTGRLIAEAGRIGRGPGELQDPEALARGSDGSVYVLDPPRVVVFEASGDSLRHDRDIPLKVAAAEDICLIGDTLFLQATSIESREQDATSIHAIHAFSLFGEELYTFAPTERHGSLLLQQYRSRGQIACFPQERRILFLPDVTPFVKTYSSAGRLLWADTIPDYRPIEFVDRGRSVSFEIMPPKGAHHGLSAVAVTPRFAAVQVGLRDSSSSSPLDHTDIRTLVYDITTGKRAGTLEVHGRLLAMDYPHMFVAVDLPYPQLVTYVPDGEYR